jgi:hypothetical protein
MLSAKYNRYAAATILLDASAQVDLATKVSCNTLQLHSLLGRRVHLFPAFSVLGHGGDRAAHRCGKRPRWHCKAAYQAPGKSQRDETCKHLCVCTAVLQAFLYCLQYWG